MARAGAASFKPSCTPTVCRHAVPDRHANTATATATARTRTSPGGSIGAIASPSCPPCIVRSSPGSSPRYTDSGCAPSLGIVSAAASAGGAAGCPPRLLAHKYVHHAHGTTLLRLLAPVSAVTSGTVRCSCTCGALGGRRGLPGQAEHAHAAPSSTGSRAKQPTASVGSAMRN